MATLNISFSAFEAVLKAFNAPFLTIFAACIPYMSVETSTQTAETACDAVDAEWAESDFSLVNRPDSLTINGNNWSMVWTSRQGNEYVFGVREDEYFVSYSETGSMKEMIRFICLGEVIPTDKFLDYPYKGNPMLVKPSAEALEEAFMIRKQAAYEEYLASLSPEDLAEELETRAEAPARATEKKQKRRGN